MSIQDVIDQERSELFARLIEQLSPGQLRQLERLMLRLRDDCPGCILVPDDDRRGPMCAPCVELGDLARPVAKVN